MTALAAVLDLVGIAEGELRLWVASGWVVPETGAEGWDFREIDIARVRLIAELRHHLAIDEETVPVVLSLLDQLYRTRRDLNALCAAVAAQSDEVRVAIARALQKPSLQ